ncbi:MAG: pilus assembly protein TadG-related protein [Roseateles sp.]|uniref:pilus assembly protein TadG-related protein n=1 Tax=Roseateles sp. TaxID=1971397 RepID=UPI0039E9F328
MRGQALIFGLLFLSCAGLVVILLFNGSMLAVTKSQLQNAADAGAYSAAVLQARDANFSAYTNRAMIANQVAVAQFVSMKSYFEDAAQTHKRANSTLEDTVYRLFPSVAPAWDIGKKVPVDTAYSAVNAMAGPAVKALDLLIDALDQAQNIHHLGTMAEMMFVADEVVKKNDPLARVTTSAFMLGDAAVRVKAWGNDATKRFSANDASKEADRFADAVVSRDSEDLFIRNRASVPVPMWASTVKPYVCPLASFTFTAYGFSHFGGTILSSNKKRWLALDATQGGGSAVCVWMVPCPVGTCPVTATVPFPDIGTTAPYLGGHGGAVAGSGGKYGEASGYKNNAAESKLYGFALTSPAVVPANYRYWSQGPGTTLDSGGGLQDHYRDMASPLTSKPANQTPLENGGKFPVTIEVERTQGTIRQSTTILPGADRLKLEDGMKGQTMRALASAHAYFYRPRLDDLKQFTRNGWRRGDHKTEYQNLFSPYWQARLAPTTIAEEAAAAAAQ